ncbi:RNA polymerase II transcriptional coactivator KELP-like isoform X1 [Triticum urartu]|uniref:RNA polymerase II transcriptional coactivator KELP-like isoform X1 n=1 Tax=Triticum urartu TaxID=4572 RepID=UPI002043FF38|nr:RNA polymerase II transcriptional coactivator KELP-like isoform X1 [Triticum urartu]
MGLKGNKRFGGGGGGGQPPAKRQAAGKDGPAEETDDGIVVAQISKNKRVAVRSWNGKVMVDMREFYEKDGKSLPTRKVEDTEGQHRSYRRGHQGEHLIGKAAKEILLGKVSLICCLSMLVV